jgi:hypothetical protein
MKTRRTFLGQALGTGAVAISAGCGPAPSAPPQPGDAGTPMDAGIEASAALLDVAGAGLPYRQDDPTWGPELMWDRDLVIRADHELNRQPLTQARSLLRAFSDGNSIGNEGCMLTSLAMVLRLFAPQNPAWTPRTLNQAAQDAYYYTPCGLSMTALYADLVSEVTHGDVQLALKEEYLAGVPGWPKTFAHTSSLVRAYRRLTPAQRTDVLLMLKTGTYDDTVASHYVLIHPNDEGGPDDDDPWVLDPAMPLDQAGPWRLTDSAATITQDPDIASAWVASAIEPTQLGGVWVFARGQGSHDRSRIAPLVRAWAAELSGR